MYHIEATHIGTKNKFITTKKVIYVMVSHLVIAIVVRKLLRRLSRKSLSKYVFIRYNCI